MATTFDSIGPDLARWLERQHIFFVATAPLAITGHINCSPKGMDAFRILGPHDVAYLDLTGSGAETIAHLKENGRIVLMFCAFEGAPKIVRLHGTGRVVEPGSREFDDLRSRFPGYAGTRAIVTAAISRVSDSCGFAVPRLEYAEERESLEKWAAKKGPDELSQYRREKNAFSIDGLPALSPRPGETGF
jgi:Pyridoxamine 5'-phosphate oxidase